LRQRILQHGFGVQPLKSRPLNNWIQSSSFDADYAPPARPSVATVAMRIRTGCMVIDLEVFLEQVPAKKSGALCGMYADLGNSGCTPVTCSLRSAHSVANSSTAAENTALQCRIPFAVEAPAQWQDLGGGEQHAVLMKWRARREKRDNRGYPVMLA
jgi:hypothetical protein